MVELFIGLVASVVCVSLYYVIQHFRIQSQKKAMLDEVRLWLDQYRHKTTGNNRFLIDDEYLFRAFPEYPPKIIKAVWREMVQMGWVQEDFIDKQWVVKP